MGAITSHRSYREPLEPLCATSYWSHYTSYRGHGELPPIGAITSDRSHYLSYAPLELQESQVPEKRLGIHWGLSADPEIGLPSES